MKRIIFIAITLVALGVVIYGAFVIHRRTVLSASVNDSLKQVFHSGDEQKQILNDLQDMGVKAVPATVQALTQTGEVGEAAELALLNNRNTKNSLSDLVRLLENKNPEVRQRAAILVVVNIRGQDTFALPVLIKTLDDTNEYVRGSVAAAISNLGPAAKPAVPALTIALTDVSTEVRIKAASALLSIDSSQKATVVSILYDAMANGNARDRWLAAFVFHKIDPQNTELIPVFISSLTNEDRNIGSSAADSLRSYGSQANAAVPILLNMLKEQNPYVQKSARSALEKINPEALNNSNVQTVGPTPESQRGFGERFNPLK